MKVLVALLALLPLVGCKRKTEYSGIGKWSVTQTSLEDAKKSGRCTPSEIPDGRKGMYCFGFGSPTIGNSHPEVDMYFASESADARPIEIQYKLRACSEEKVETFLATNFGDPLEQRVGRKVFKTRHMTLIAFVPEKPGFCMLRLFPNDETAEIERVKKL